MKMSRMFGNRLILLACILTLCVAQINIAAASDSGQLVSAELLRHAGLKAIWESDLPIKKTESLEQLVILGDRIYAISDRNYMTSVNKENGKRVFAKVFAPPGAPITGLKLYGDELLSVAGSKVLQCDAVGFGYRLGGVVFLGGVEDVFPVPLGDGFGLVRRLRRAAWWVDEVGFADLVCFSF